MTIKELQDWVDNDWKTHRKSPPPVLMQLLYLIEELGEVAEAIRKHESVYDREGKAQKAVDIGGEMGDLLISLMTLANHYGIDLTSEVQKFQKKVGTRRAMVSYK